MSEPLSFKLKSSDILYYNPPLREPKQGIFFIHGFGLTIAIPWNLDFTLWEFPHGNPAPATSSP